MKKKCSPSQHKRLEHEPGTSEFMLIDFFIIQFGKGKTLPKGLSFFCSSASQHFPHT